jgi:hypothetical protein
MAESGPIRVCMLEGLYAHLSLLGFSLSVAAEVQSSNLRLDSAKWLIRQSGPEVVFQSPSFGPRYLVEGRAPTNLLVSVIIGDVIVSRSPWPILVLVMILQPFLS